MDSIATIDKLKLMVQNFCEERDWNQFHGPKDLAIGLSTEANELLEIFRFKSQKDIENIMNGEKRTHVEEELADVFYFVLRFAQMNGIDLENALIDKLGKSGAKYPVDKFKGSNKKYNE